MAKLASTTIYGSLTITDPSNITVGSSTKLLDCISDLNFTLNDIGAMAKSGDKMSGTLLIDAPVAGFAEGIRIKPSHQGWCTIAIGTDGSATGTIDGQWGIFRTANSDFLIAHNSSSDNAGLSITKAGNILFMGNSMYHTGNKPTYTDVGAISKTVYDKEWTIQLSPVAGTWMSTGIRGLDSGAYLFQLFASNNGVDGHYSESYYGILSWYSGDTNSSVVTEIPLTSSGNATESIFMAAGYKRVYGNTVDQEIVIACSHTTSDVCNYTIRVKRIG